MATNNDYLSDIAGLERKNGLTNNSLLRFIAENGGLGGLTPEQRELLASIAYKADLVNGKVPESQLPSYVDNVQEEPTVADFPATGTSNVIYVATETNAAYRWSGTTYVQIGSGVVLGETESSAYRGDRGKTAYDHTMNFNNPHQVTKAQVGLSQVDNTSDAEKPVSTATSAALALKADTTALNSLDDSVNTRIQQQADNIITEVGNALNTKVDKDGTKVLSDNNFTTEEKAKLESLEPFDPSGLQASIDTKVDKLEGYGLSETSFTQAEKNKLANIAERYFGRYTSEEALQNIVGIPGGYAYVSLPGIPTDIFAWNAETNQWDNTALAQGEETAESIKTKYESNPDTNAFTDMEKMKLAAILIDATKNDTNANLRDRSTHTGTQPQSTITGLSARLTDIDNLIEAIIRIDDGQTLVLEDHRNNRNNPHMVTKSQVGLGNADNTSDADKPVSRAQQAALDNKANFPATSNSVPVRNSAGNQASFIYGSSAEPTTIMFRDGSGRTNVATPTLGTHAANKAYVDSVAAGIPTTSTLDGWRVRTYADRVEYYRRFSYSVSIGTGGSRYVDWTSSFGFPGTIRPTANDELFLVNEPSNRVFTANLRYESGTNRFVVGFNNNWTETVTGSGNVSAKLIRYTS